MLFAQALKTVYSVPAPAGEENNVMPDWTLARRRERISSLKEDQGAFSINFRSERHDLKIYVVPIELPQYRLANGRTVAAQKEYIKKNGLAADYFEDPDSERAQAVQDDILWRTVSGKTLYKVLQRQPQNEPLLVTPSGYVVNGNRRLCAMRRLLKQEPEKYQRFGQVRVCVLPERFDEQEIQRLESELQLQPETKEEYSWVDKAMMKRRLLDSGVDDKDVAAIYGQVPSEIKKQVNSLALAEEYLRSRQKDQLYSSLPKAEHTFYRLFEGFRVLRNPADQDLLKFWVFALLDDPTGADRIYLKVPNMAKHFSKMVAAMAEEANVADSLDEDSDGSKDLDDILGKPDPPSPSEQLLNRLKSIEIEDSTRLRDIILLSTEQVTGAEKKKSSNERSLNHVKTARIQLQSAVGALIKNSNTVGMRDYLAQIEMHVGQLRKWLDGAS